MKNLEKEKENKGTQNGLLNSCVTLIITNINVLQMTFQTQSCKDLDK